MHTEHVEQQLEHYIRTVFKYGRRGHISTPLLIPKFLTPLLPTCMHELEVYVLTKAI